MGSSRVTLREVARPRWPTSSVDGSPGWSDSRTDRHIETLQPVGQRPESMLLEGGRGGEETLC